MAKKFNPLVKFGFDATLEHSIISPGNIYIPNEVIATDWFNGENIYPLNEYSGVSIKAKNNVLYYHNTADNGTDGLWTFDYHGTLNAEFKNNMPTLDNEIWNLLIINDSVLLTGRFTGKIISLNLDGTINANFTHNEIDDVVRTILVNNSHIAYYCAYGSISRNVKLLDLQGNLITTLAFPAGVTSADAIFSIGANVYVRGSINTYKFIFKYDLAGNLDTTFNTPGGSRNGAEMLRIKDKLYIQDANYLVRFNDDGSIDSSFINPFSSYPYYSVFDAKEDSLGRVYVAGYFFPPDWEQNGDINYGVMRLNSDLTIDESFKLDIRMPGYLWPEVNSLYLDESKNCLFIVGAYMGEPVMKFNLNGEKIMPLDL